MQAALYHRKTKQILYDSLETRAILNFKISIKNIIGPVTFV